MAALFADSGIRRPVNDLRRIAKMLKNANLTIAAWQGEELVAIARCVTDFSYYYPRIGFKPWADCFHIARRR